MTVKKKNEVDSAGAQVNLSTQVIAVDVRKLSQGLKTTFEGVSMVFDSIGVEVEMPVINDNVVTKEEVKEAVNKPADANKRAADKLADIKVDEPATEAVTKSVEKAEVQSQGEAKPDAEAEPAVEQEALKTLTSSVTADDITKVIVQKIKQNRNNNDKIGAILKTFGVAKVSELPVDKYEAFLTELAEI